MQSYNKSTITVAEDESSVKHSVLGGFKSPPARFEASHLKIPIMSTNALPALSYITQKLFIALGLLHLIPKYSQIDLFATTVLCIGIKTIN